MTVRAYFELGETAQTVKRFKAIQWKPHINIPGDVRQDLLGNFVGVRGFTSYADEVMVKCHRDTATGDYGTFQDLKSLILHKGELVYVDFDNNSHNVLINPGMVSPEAISTILDGHAAVMLTPLLLIYKEEDYP